ncbi:MAG: hypothetical protein GSR85_00765 [Desulfurococcales archaeon]|nr:hypothetical protein [Desulfurococcales archaeon]
MAQEFYEDEDKAREPGPRVEPGKWLPLLKDAYTVISRLARRFGVGVVIAGAGAYSLHVEADPTKDVDFVLTKPLPPGDLAMMLQELESVLKTRGWRVLGGRLQHGRVPEDWVVQVFVAVDHGKVVGIEVFNLLAVRPLSFYEVTEVTYKGVKVKVITLESWVASKLADPNGIDKLNVERLERAVEKEINEAKLLDILRRLGMREVIPVNARSVLRRTRSERLKRLLQMLV